VAASENEPRVATSRKTESRRASNITAPYQSQKARSLVFIRRHRDHPSMTSTASLTIRHATATDEADLIRLAALDSSRVPSGELLVAQVDGNLVAALSVDTGAAIADPFEHTAAILDSMRAQIRASRAPRPAVLPGHLGRALFGRA
jgi:hypothetical protein